jgi:hypothetical protein
MAVTLLPLSDGHYSLEFEPSDLPLVASVIRDRYGVPEKEHHPTCVEYRFGGCSFVFQNEWDDPCLISGSAQGDDILKALYEILSTRA